MASHVDYFDLGHLDSERLSLTVPTDWLPVGRMRHQTIWKLIYQAPA